MNKIMTNTSHRPAASVRMLMLSIAGLFIGGLIAASNAAASSVTLKSPDGKIVVTIQTGGHLSYGIAFHDKPVVEHSTLGLILDDKDLGADALFAGRPEAHEINEQYPVMGVHDTAINHCISTTIPVVSGAAQWQLEFRVFNDGVACRYHVPAKGARHINGEATEWKVPVGSVLWFLSASNTSYEARIDCGIVGQLPQGLQLMAPATLEFPDHAGYGMMTEANLVNYSDMSLKTEGDAFKAFFRNSQAGWTATDDIVSPWRVTVLAADLNTLVNSDLIKNLCPPPSPELAKAAWIRPGRSVWHWLTGGGPKLEEQPAWIDGAKQLGYEYYLVDDGWRNWDGGGTNAWNALAKVVQYARSQHARIRACGNAEYTPTLLIPGRLNGSSFAHELAMAIVFTSPYLCMGDNPKHYLDSEACDVLKALPAVWDQTLVLPQSKIGQLAAFARRHGDQWFIGVINNTTPRREQIDLNFLGKGNFKFIELADSPKRR